MFEYGDDEDYVRENASKLRGRNVQEARDMDRGEEVNDSNRTLLSDYLEGLEGLETPSESLKQTYSLLHIYNQHQCSRNCVVSRKTCFIS